MLSVVRLLWRWAKVMLHKHMPDMRMSLRDAPHRIGSRECPVFAGAVAGDCDCGLKAARVLHDCECVQTDASQRNRCRMQWDCAIYNEMKLSDAVGAFVAVVVWSERLCARNRGRCSSLSSETRTEMQLKVECWVGYTLLIGNHEMYSVIYQRWRWQLRKGSWNSFRYNLSPHLSVCLRSFFFMVSSFK